MRGTWLIYPILIAVGMAFFPTKKIVDQIEKTKGIVIPKDVTRIIDNDIKLPIGKPSQENQDGKYNLLSSLLDNNARVYTSSVKTIQKNKDEKGFFKSDRQAEQRPLPSIAILGYINGKVMANIIAVPDGEDKNYPLMKTLKTGDILEGWVVKSTSPLRLVCNNQEIEVKKEW